MGNKILKSGIKAWFDSFAGLVPVSVLAVTPPAEVPLFDLVHGAARASVAVRARVTKDHGPYRKGEEITSNSLHVVPCGAIIRGQYSLGIGFYDVAVDMVQS